jgi:hypothetical protein
MTDAHDHNNDETIDPLELVDDIVRAVDDLPIISRLEMVGNILQANGGERHSTPQSQIMIVAFEILTQATEVIRKHPAAADLRALHLNPGD